MNTLLLLFNKNDDAECSDKSTGGRIDNQKEGVEVEININEVRKHFEEVTVLRSGGLISPIPERWKNWHMQLQLRSQGF